MGLKLYTTKVNISEGGWQLSFSPKFTYAITFGVKTNFEEEVIVN